VNVVNWRSYAILIVAVRFFRDSVDNLNVGGHIGAGLVFVEAGHAAGVENVLPGERTGQLILQFLLFSHCHEIGNCPLGCGGFCANRRRSGTAAYVPGLDSLHLLVG